ncbi:MAG: uroporphyrinogen decarboxylase [Actinomycetota bacterium]
MSPTPHSVPFLDAAAGRPAAHTPVWFMRQAGRHLPEYRALRGEGSILDAIKQVDLSVELTLQPVRRYGVDAAVLYSDIVVPAHAIGFGIDVAPGTGPVCAQPFRTEADLARLRAFEPEADTPYVLDTVRTLAAELPPEVPLLAFAGAPFTVASYLVEGRPSRTYEHTKRMLYTAPALWQSLMERLVQHAVASIASQLANGAKAFQLFDSWAGTLSRSDYDRFVLPHSRAVFTQLRALHPDAPGIHYGVGCDHLLESMLAAGTSVLGLDWRTPISQARARMGADLVVQGNLDPVLALAGAEPALVGTDAVLDDNVLPDGSRHPGHIFNLGHGVHPPTDPDVLAAVVARVHERTAR